MIAYATYCSHSKSPEPVLVPAVRRYASGRIGKVAAIADLDGRPLRILSGKYGWLKPDSMIEDYDHLLTRAEVPELAAGVTGRLSEEGTQAVVFFARRPYADPNVEPYLEVIERACRGARVRLCIVWLGETEADHRSEAQAP